MKWLSCCLVGLLFSGSVSAYTPDQYAQQVVQKDLPLSLRWFGKAAQSEHLSQVEVYDLYQSALPATQVNKQLGISTKGSVERMLILLDGAQYFEPIQKAPVDFQNKKELVSALLQITYDEMNRFQYGEDPQTLIEEWQGKCFQLYGADFTKFSSDLRELFISVQKFLSSPMPAVPEQKENAEMNSEEGKETFLVKDAVIPEEAEEPFENQRLKSYIDSAEGGKVADECQNASTWQTDQAEFCQNDDSLECDRSYARQCKKLQ